MEEQKKSNLKEKLLKIKQTVFSFFKKLFLKFKNTFVLLGQKFKKLFLFLWSKTKGFFQKVFIQFQKAVKYLYIKLKLGFKYIWLKIKNFFNYLYNKIKVLNPIIKAVIILVIVFSTVTVIAINNIHNEKIKNLTSYNILNEALIYQNLFVLEDNFFEIEDEFISSYAQQEIKNFYIIYSAMKNNYLYYANLLKNVKNTNANMRNHINAKLTFIEDRSIYVNSYSKIILLELENEVPDAVFINTISDSLLHYLKEIVYTSLYLIPQIENYIFLYGNESLDNKLQIYLTKLQFHYAYNIIELVEQGQFVENQLNDLNNIIKKFEQFSGASNNVYKDDFINAFENYYANNYYKAADKFIYKSRSDLTQEEKTYAQAFYNFLMQASYN